MEQINEGLAPLDASNAVVVSLRGDMPDDAWDETEALDILNAHTEDGAYWELHDGDLLLRETTP